MASLIELPSFHETRGSLTVIEKIIPFEIKRVFYIYNVDDSVRGRHRHHKTIQAAICISGSCRISSDDGREVNEYILNSPDKCLILNPEDFHWMHNFSKDAILLVLASEYFNTVDYIFEPYAKRD
ncbi:MAG: FdtA/QdtA family cupin domain-containing protein [Bacteroidales bacterium]|jgi:dTDP-4-dehydrorhamnose 3,5-epimerase-like enzyme